MENLELTESALIFGGSSAAGGRNVKLRLSTLECVAPFPSGSFVDIGGGEGSYAIELLAHCQHLTLVDVHADAITVAKRRLEHSSNVEFLIAPAEQTGMPAEAFEAAFMIEVLDHVNDTQATMKEAYRLLKPGGRLYLTAPNKLFPMETHPLHIGSKFYGPRWAPFLPWMGWLHKRIATARVFTVGDLSRLAEGAGFVNMQVDYLMPPFENYPRLQALAEWVGKTPLRRFGVSLCATMRKPG